MATAPKSVFSHITKNPKVRGGKACVEGTRISVKDIVCLHEEGPTPEQMLNVFGTPLTLSQIRAALAYYYDHQDEIDAIVPIYWKGDGESKRASKGNPGKSSSNPFPRSSSSGS